MKIDKSKRSDQVAEGIKEMIRNGIYKEGDRLPIENDLAKEFGVGRNTIREAIIKLSLVGAVTVRQGEGTFVQKPTAASLVTPLFSFLELNKKTISDIFEVRLTIECKSAELAARNASEEDLDAIQEELKAMSKAAEKGDSDSYNTHDYQFHYQVCKASHNEVLLAIQNLLANLVKSSIEIGTTPIDALKNSIFFHKAIYDALRKHEGLTARSLMQAHLQGGVSFVNEIEEA